MRKILLFTILLFILSIPLLSQEPETAALDTSKKALSFEDYARWRSISSTALSEDGAWVSYAYSRQESDDTLYVKHLETDTTYMVSCGSNLSFSDDSKWAAYFINTPYKKAKKLRDDNKPVPRKAELLELASGEKKTIDNASSLTFAKGSAYFAVKKTKTDQKTTHRGTDLYLHNLSTGLGQLLGNVAEFSFNKPGSYLAYTIDCADTTGNGIYLIHLETNSTMVLDTDAAIYRRLSWDEEGRALAVLKGTKKKKMKHSDNVLLAFTDFKKTQYTRHEFTPAETYEFPKNSVLSELGTLSWSTDNAKLFFGIKEQEADIKKEKDAPPIADVDVFHWNDERIQTVQIRQAARDRNFTYRGVYFLDTKKFVQLTDETMRTIDLTRDGNWGIGRDDRAYVSDWQPRYADYYAVNTRTGVRVKILEKQLRTLGLSPDSKHFLYWKDGQIWDYQLAANRAVNVTKNCPVSFVNQEFDRFGEKPPYGVTGWSEDGKSLILNAQYDLWRVSLDGADAENLTDNIGADQEIRFRYLRLDDEEKFIDLSEPMLLSAYGQWTKKSGFYRVAKGSCRPLVFEEASYGRLRKAKQADRYLFTRETVADYPNYWLSDVNFGDRRRLTDANPWQSEYFWGYSELIDYTNSQGVRLQGALAIPETYERGQKLPMLVMFYEKRSQNLHRYPTPSYASRPNQARFLSHGYLILQPDVHFNLRTSHSDMVECVEAAVKKVIELGYADPERVGLHGHSYSGGGSAYIATRSTMFAAIASGAAPIDLVSEFNQLFRGTGMNNHSYDIYGQGRYVTNPYDDFELYWDQSPIAHVRTMNTPLLYLHGVDDPTVEYLQGMEFYNALRFNEKNIIFLSYPGEGHSLRKPENQKDYTKRVNAFLDHHLKGTPAPKWMTEGIPFLKKKK